MADTEDWPHVLVVSHWGFIRGLTGQELRNGEHISFSPVEESPGAFGCAGP